MHAAAAAVHSIADKMFVLWCAVVLQRLSQMITMQREECASLIEWEWKRKQDRERDREREREIEWNCWVKLANFGELNWIEMNVCIYSMPHSVKYGAVLTRIDKVNIVFKLSVMYYYVLMPRVCLCVCVGCCFFTVILAVFDYAH